MTTDRGIAVLGLGSLGVAVATRWAAEFSVRGTTRTRQSAERARARGIDAIAADDRSDANLEVARGADVVVLACRPNEALSLAREIAPVLPEDALVISMAVGVRLADVQSALGRSTNVVRAMPNTSAAHGRSMCGLSGDCGTERAGVLLRHLGPVRLIDEAQLDDFSAVAASGIAHVLWLLQGVVDGGLRLGFDEQTSLDMAAGVLMGAEALMSNGDGPLRELIAGLATPGGSTQAGISLLERMGVRGSVAAAVVSTAGRAALLRDGQGNEPQADGGEQR